MNSSHRLMSFISITSFIACTGLLCCTLPILLVSLGVGSMMASIASTFTWLPMVSEYKFWIFFISGIMFLISDISYHRKNKVCPADPKLAKYCQTIDHVSGYILNFGLVIWLIGFTSAYLLYPLSIIL